MWVTSSFQSQNSPSVQFQESDLLQSYMQASSCDPSVVAKIWSFNVTNGRLVRCKKVDELDAAMGESPSAGTQPYQIDSTSMMSRSQSIQSDQ